MSTTLEQLELPITGMTCASCANRVERKLNKLEGVTATVNYATEKARVQFDPVPLPGPSDTASIGDGYEVSLHGDIVAGEESELEFTIRRNGEVVDEIPDYLGAKGHLVALRDGDLAYLHVHPEEDRLTFETDFPSAGEYRLFLQFDHGGAIRTAPFTINAEEAE